MVSYIDLKFGLLIEQVVNVHAVGPLLSQAVCSCYGYVVQSPLNNSKLTETTKRFK